MGHIWISPYLVDPLVHQHQTVWWIRTVDVVRSRTQTNGLIRKIVQYLSQMGGICHVHNFPNGMEVQVVPYLGWLHEVFQVIHIRILCEQRVREEN